MDGKKIWFQCAFCRVSFNTARLRTLTEPLIEAWAVDGSQGWVCPPSGTGLEPCATDRTGCVYLVRDTPRTARDGSRPARKNEVVYCDHIPAIGNQLPIGRPRTASDQVLVQSWCLEHVAGPDCVSNAGYKSRNISLGESHACRTIQCLVPKDYVDDWEPEGDDLSLELDSHYFLSGIAGDAMDLARVPPCMVVPARHGAFEPEPVCLSQADWAVGDAMPFHPYCFDIYMRLSRSRFGGVDVNRLMSWFYSGMHNHFRPNLDEAVQRGEADPGVWNHVDGDEWLVANPTYMLQLNALLGSANIAIGPFDPDQSAFGRGLSSTVPYSQQDPFARLPMELKHLVIGHLGSKDIASLRLASRNFYHLPFILWYRLLREDMPWVWEIYDDEPPYFWATVTEHDIHSHANEGWSAAVNDNVILSHTINVKEHLSQAPWKRFVPPLRLTNWHALYVNIKRHSREIKGLRNRRRIWLQIEEMLSAVMQHDVSDNE